MKEGKYKMANFCGKCGSKLNQSGLCPNCDFKQIPNRNEYGQQMDEVLIQKNQPQTKKGKRTGKVIIKIFAVMLAAAIALIGTVGVLSYFGIVNIFGISSVFSNLTPATTFNTAEKNNVITNGENEYYIGGTYVVKLKEDNSVAGVHYDDLEEESMGSDDDNTNILSLALDKTVYDGNTIYAQQDDIRNELYKFVFKDDDTMERSVWISEEALNNSVVVTEKESKDLGYTGNMTCWRLDGDYVYFIYAPDKAYFMNEMDIAYRLGRISKDGLSIEFIGNEIASSYTVKDDWIYYYDNGYTYNKNLSEGYEIDYNRAGIYKMRGDGSNKQKLLGNLGKRGAESSYNELCDELEIYGEYIYFLDYTEVGRSRVCRMNTDGSDFEYVSENGAFDYTLDTENNILYYITGEYGQASVGQRTVYISYLGMKNDEVLFEYKYGGCSDLTFYNNYLYFSDDFTGGLVGLRYSIITKGKDGLVANYEEEEVNYSGIITYIKHGPFMNWEKVDE